MRATLPARCGSARLVLGRIMQPYLERGRVRPTSPLWSGEILTPVLENGRPGWARLGYSGTQ
jgi:hypothetical protein